MSARIRRSLALLAVAAILGTGCSFGGSDDTYTVAAEFDRSFNLFEGSRVRVLGVDVGRVIALEVPEGADAVSVQLEIRRDVKLPADVVATIVPEALLGERYVQLAPAYVSGPEFEPGGTLGTDRTTIPAEWDELFETLNDLVTELDEDELARLVQNLAAVLDGRGDDLGRVLEQTSDAVDALESTDDEIVELASSLADLNQTLNTRTDAIGRIIDDWNTVITAIADQRGDLDTALGGLSRFTEELAALLVENRADLEADVAVLTRVGRTAQRNLDQLQLGIRGQADLFEFGSKAFDFDRNWMPLVNHTAGLTMAVSDRLNQRLAGVCIRLGIAECSTPDFFEGLEGLDDVCIPPLVECATAADTPTNEDPSAGPDDDGPIHLGDALERVFAQVPELRDAMVAAAATNGGRP